MDPYKNALEIVKQACSVSLMSLGDHQRTQQALSLLETLINSPKVPKEDKEDKKKDK